MDSSKSLIPHILCAMSSSPNQQQSLDRIVRFVEERLGEKGKLISNIREKIKMAIADCSAFGLLSTNKDIVRLRYNPKSKPPFPFHPPDDCEDRDEELYDDDDDDAQNEPSTASDHKTREKPKSSKNSSKKPSEYSIFVPEPTEIRRRKRKSRSRSRRGRSKSAKRRRKR